ncbi:MAG: sulfatase-like hydrolase/transferase, partial [Verrucomicrobiota bacterium]
YQTGIIGKWHMGGDFHEKGSKKIYRGAKGGDIVDKVDLTRWAGGGPRYCGFDYDFITPCGIQGPLYLLYENEKWYPWSKDSKIIHFNEDTARFPKDLTSKGDGPGDSNWDSRQLADILSGKAVDFIKDKADDEKPFFLYYCMPLVHAPHCPPASFDGQKIKGQSHSAHLDMVVTLDLEIKRIVDALKETGQFDNTLFILTSDNGGLGDKKAAKQGYNPSGGWAGAKGSPLEGGHRVPFIAVWPGRIKPAISDELVVGQDLVATLAALVGTEIPEGQAQDSNNLLPLLTGEGEFHQRGTWINQAGSKQEVMIRRMPWKLIIQSNPKRTKFEPKALYNLEKDPTESKNLLEDPKHASRAQKLFKEYKETVKSGRPTVKRK